MKRCSTLPVNQGNANQTIMRYHLTSAGWQFQETKDNKYQKGCGKIKTLVHCWWEGKMAQLLWKATWRFLKKLKM